VHCFIIIKMLYFQIITDNLKMPVVRMIFLSFYIALVLTNMYAYCYSAEKLITEVR